MAETRSILQTDLNSNGPPSLENVSHDQRRKPKNNAATGASAAGFRAVASQMVAFYFRAPVKSFFRTRVDYLAFARAINPRVQAKEAWSWRLSTAGLINHAVREFGWGFIPNHVLPPLLANVGVGAILYTSYLQIVGSLHSQSSQTLKRVYPPPPISSTSTAGFMAGAIQSVVAAPLDALQARFHPGDVLDGKYKNMWQYGQTKLREIGARGVFAGWGFSFVKDSIGYAAFFAIFEYIKAQSYYAFVTKYYGSFQTRSEMPLRESSANLIITPHFTIEPAFLMLAGVSASIAQQAIQHPITMIQAIHYLHASHPSNSPPLPPSAAYQRTYRRCLVHARRSGGWRRWLFRGFFINSVKQVPSTSAGLVIFELVRRRYGSATETVRIRKDGYDILLN